MGTIDISQLITWIVIGAIAGWLAEMVLTGHKFGTLASIGIGLIGAIVGGILFNLLKIQVPSFLSASLTIKLSDIIIAFVGAVLVILIAGVVYRRRV